MDEWKDAPGNEDEHYSGTIQPINFSHSWDFPLTLQNVIKYICRHSKKGKKLDFEKALWYIDFEMENQFAEKCISVDEFTEAQGLDKRYEEIFTLATRYKIHGSSKYLETMYERVKELMEEEYGE
jgi:hypothetical protein